MFHVRAPGNAARYLLRTDGRAPAHPTASFRLTEPVELGGVPVAGETLTLATSGELTRNGVTRSVEPTVEAVLLADADRRRGVVPGNADQSRCIRCLSARR